MAEEIYEEQDIYTLTDEEGNESEFELIASQEIDGTTYVALVPYDPEKKDAVTTLMEGLTGGAQTLIQGNSAQAHFENILKDLQRNSGSLALMPYTFSQY